MILRHFYGIIVRGETVSALRASHSEEQRPTVFLAHSHGDKAYVREIYRLLKLDGFHPWLDEMNLVAGQNWELEVEKAVQTADAIAVFMSSKALDSAGYLHKEIRIALDVAERLPEGAIKVIPIRLDRHEVPRKLQHLHWSNSDRIRFNPRLSKAGAIEWYEKWDDKLSILRKFSIGDRYLQLQQALIVLDHGLESWSQHRVDEPGRDSADRSVEFLVRGQHKDSNRYYGRASMRIVTETEHPPFGSGRKVTLNSSIEGADYRYGGSIWDSSIDLDGEHKVRYWIGSTGDLAVGTWDSGGLEELISAHANDAPPFGRWY